MCLTEQNESEYELTCSSVLMGEVGGSFLGVLRSFILGKLLVVHEESWASLDVFAHPKGTKVLLVQQGTLG